MGSGLAPGPTLKKALCHTCVFGGVLNKYRLISSCFVQRLFPLNVCIHVGWLISSCRKGLSPQVLTLIGGVKKALYLSCLFDGVVNKYRLISDKDASDLIPTTVVFSWNLCYIVQCLRDQGTDLIFSYLSSILRVQPHFYFTSHIIFTSTISNSNNLLHCSTIPPLSCPKETMEGDINTGRAGGYSVTPASS